MFKECRNHKEEHTKHSLAFGKSSNIKFEKKANPGIYLNFFD